MLSMRNFFICPDDNVTFLYMYFFFFQTDDEGKRKRLLSVSDFDEVS